MKNDKLLHLVVGFLFGAATYASQMWGLGLLISTLVFVGKEVFDKYKPHPTGFDKADLFVDYLGFGLGFGSAGFVHGIIKLFV